jgi:hypothetical protein
MARLAFCFLQARQAGVFKRAVTVFARWPMMQEGYSVSGFRQQRNLNATSLSPMAFGGRDIAV